MAADGARARAFAQWNGLAPSSGGQRRRRWLIRILAFSAILSYGVFIVRSPRQLDRLLDAAFDAVASSAEGATAFLGISEEDGRDVLGFRPTNYHDHIRTRNGGGHAGAHDVEKSVTSAVRISFELHDPKAVPLRNAFNLYVKCPLGKVTTGKRKVPTGEFRSGKLPPTLVRVKNEDGGGRSGRVLDFTVTVSTDLKLLLIGDSVMVQLAQAFDEMIMEAGGRATADHPGDRAVAWEAWRGHDGGTVVAPTRGGGVSAMWRMTALLSISRKGKPPANSAGGGWSDKEIDGFLKYTYNTQKNTTTIGSFDVVVFRVMHGWMKMHEITRERLVEAVELAHEVLGASTVVLMTIPFTNNVKTVDEMEQAYELNEFMRETARGWHLRENSSGVRRVLVLEYGTYYDHVIWSNGRHIGYNVTHPLRATRETFESERPGFAFDRLSEGGEWSPSIPMVCSDLKSLGKERKKCDRNYLFSDGMHTCPESLAGRYAAGLACLIGCEHNGRGRNDTGPEREMNVRACERECNVQFLSVVPVEESWIGSNTTMASFSG